MVSVGGSLSQTGFGDNPREDGDVQLIRYHHEAFERHDTGARHPERPERLDAAMTGIDIAGVEFETRAPSPASLEALHSVHPAAYVASIEAFCAAGGGALDPDTRAVPASWGAALRAAGAGLDAVDALRAGEADAAFAVVRPPGHHAEASRAMGFCLFNNIAVAAAAITAAGERVAIVDWDVHHGNGTQDTFYGRDDVLYVSTHEFPLYPGTGWVEEAGVGAGAGFTVNLPLPSRTGGDVFDAAWERLVGPVVAAFDPDWMLVSAGYDAHRADPLADLMLESDDYGRMAGRVAQCVEPGRFIFFLEGGYDLEAVSASVASTVRGAGGAEHGVGPTGSPDRSWRMLDLAVTEASKHWDVG